MILDRLKFPDYNECQSFSFELPGKILTLRVPDKDCDYAVFEDRIFSEIPLSDKECVQSIDHYTRIVRSSWVYENQNYEPVMQVNLSVGVIELSEGREKIFNLCDQLQREEYIIDFRKRLALRLAEDFRWSQDDLSKKYYYTSSVAELRNYRCSKLNWIVSISGTIERVSEHTHFDYPLTPNTMLEAVLNLSVAFDTAPPESEVSGLKQHAVDQFFKHVELTDYPAS